MPPSIKNLAGKSFNNWTVVSFSHTDSYGAHWTCVCECGSVRVVRGSQLSNGGSKSCGCLPSGALPTHGMSKHPLYAVWVAMITRCHNPDYVRFYDYGGRGIYVCAEWRENFVLFKDWAFTHGYVPGLSLERKNNDGPYSPDNCTWASMVVQGNNKRNNRLVLHQDKWCTVRSLLAEGGPSYAKVYARIFQLGWSVEKALSTP